MKKASLTKVFEKHLKGEITRPAFTVTHDLRDYGLHDSRVPHSGIVNLDVAFYRAEPGNPFVEVGERIKLDAGTYANVSVARDIVRRAEETVDKRARKKGGILNP